MNSLKKNKNGKDCKQIAIVDGVGIMDIKITTNISELIMLQIQIILQIMGNYRAAGKIQ